MLFFQDLVDLPIFRKGLMQLMTPVRLFGLPVLAENRVDPPKCSTPNGEQNDRPLQSGLPATNTYLIGEHIRNIEWGLQRNKETEWLLVASIFDLGSAYKRDDLKELSYSWFAKKNMVEVALLPKLLIKLYHAVPYFQLHILVIKPDNGTRHTRFEKKYVTIYHPFLYIHLIHSQLQY